MEILDAIKTEAAKRPLAMAALTTIALGIFIAQFAFKKFTVHKHGAVFITGCSSGIGYHMATYIARKLPYMVFATVRKDEDTDKLRLLNLKNLIPLKMEVCDVDACAIALKQMLDELETAKLPLIGVIHNAAVSMMGTVEFTDMDRAHSLFETNFFSPVRLTKQLLPLLRQSKGRVIMISSIAGTNAMPTASIYSASKFALEGFSMALRKEIEPLGLSVSIIKPGLVRSEMSRKVNEEVQGSDSVEELKVYSALYDSIKQRFERYMRRADDPKVVAWAVVDALTSPFPWTRYHVANVGGFPAWLYEYVLWLLPDRFK